MQRVQLIFSMLPITIRARLGVQERSELEPNDGIFHSELF